MRGERDEGIFDRLSDVRSAEDNNMRYEKAEGASIGGRTAVGDGNGDEGRDGGRGSAERRVS